MNILIDARPLGRQPGGVGIYACRFVRALAGCEDICLALVTDVAESEELRELASLGLTVLVYGRAVGQGPSLLGYCRFLQKVIRQRRPDLFWEVNNLLPFRPKLYGGKYLVTVHDLFPLTLPRAYPLRYRLYFRYGVALTLRCCDAVLFDAETTRREIVTRFPFLREKAQVVSYAIVPPSAPSSDKRGEDFLYLGHLEYRKGVDLLLDAYRLYRERGGKRALILAGNIHDHSVEPVLRKAGALPGLSVAGYVSGAERAELLQSCHALLFPSRGEGFGLPLLEALSCGAPVLASDLPIFRELAGDAVTRFPLRGGSEALCAAMLLDELPAPAAWDNPYTAEKLLPGLLAFLRRLTRKTLRFDAQVLMDETPGGIGQLADATVRAAAKDGRFACELAAFQLRRTAAQLARLERFGLPVQRCRWFPRGLYLRLWHTFPLPYSLFFPKKADINVFFNYDLPPGVKGKAVVYVHDMTCFRFPETMDKTVLRLLRQNLADSCRRADAVVTISDFSRAEILAFLDVPPEKLRVIPCGVDHRLFYPRTDLQALEALKQRLGIAGDYFLYVGTLEPRKNLPLLLQAYEALLEREADCPLLVLAGASGWKNTVLSQALSAPALRGHVRCTGYLPREELPVLMSGAVAFVYPSLYEGFGMPPLEAMACGAPVIVSDRASLPEVVGEAGLCVPVETAAPLCEAMARLLHEEDTRRERSRRGLERAARFTWEQAAERLMSI